MFITYRNHHHMVKNMKCKSVINAINNNSIIMFYRAHGFKKTCKRSLWFWLLLLLLFYLTRCFLFPCYFSMPPAIHPGLSRWAPLALSSTLVISVCFFSVCFFSIVSLPQFIASSVVLSGRHLLIRVLHLALVYYILTPLWLRWAWPHKEILLYVCTHWVILSDKHMVLNYWCSG